MKTLSLCLMAFSAISAGAASSAERAVSLTDDPIVMRLNKNEFRIAFGINGERCAQSGCTGLIRYRVDWKTDGGIARSEIKHVDYVVLPRTGRTIAVDRQYFDTAEGQHTTDIVKVSVDTITCVDGVAAPTR